MKIAYIYIFSNLRQKSNCHEKIPYDVKKEKGKMEERKSLKEDARMTLFTWHFRL